MLEDLTTDDLTPEARKQLARKLSGELAKAIKPEPITTPMSLYRIEAEMAELGELYHEALAEGDEEAVLAIQAEVQRYVAAEVQKVDNCAGFIRYAKDMGERIAAEEARLARARHAWERITDGVKAMVLGVLQSTGQRKLQGKFSRFRVQKNSQDSVVIDDPGKVPVEFLRVTVTINLTTWLKMEPAFASAFTQKGTAEVSLSRIKQFIEAGMACPECDGAKGFMNTTTDIDEAPEYEPCQRCNGTGRVPTTVAGARLVRGEHLRVE